MLLLVINVFDFDFALISGFQLEMEERTAIRNHKDSEESSPPPHALDNNRPNPLERVARKSKKESLKDKKKGKKHPKEPSITTNHANQPPLQLLALTHHQLPSIQELSEVPHEMGQYMPSELFPIPLDKILKKPTYMTITNQTKVGGSFGHATAFFKRPVLQGTFFMDYILREDKKKEKKTTFHSATRLGLCLYAFNHSFPIGWGESIAYRSSDGAIVYRGEIIHRGEPYSVGDRIGVFLKMSPPYKHADPLKVSQNSSVTFYKNGVQMYCFRQLKQTFYCFAMSLYNYAQVEVVPKSVKNLLYTTGQHYFDCLREVIPYKDLQESNIFRI